MKNDKLLIKKRKTNDFIRGWSKITVCDLCKEESKVSYICPYCGKSYCRKHRKPEDHQCTEYDKNGSTYKFKDDTEETLLPELVNNIDKEQQKKSKEENSLQNNYEHNAFSYDGEIDEANISTNNESLNENIISNFDKQKNNSYIIHEDKKANDQEKNTIAYILSENKILIISIVIVSIIIGALMGTLIMPKENNDNIEQRYEALFNHYQEVQAKNQNLTLQLEQNN